MKLAALAALGVVAMHAVHLTLGNTIASRALLLEQERLGRGLSRLLADQAADAVLVNDVVALDAIVASAVAARDTSVAWCFITRRGAVLASSFGRSTPPALVSLRVDGNREPLVVVNGSARALDLVAPIAGNAGELRLGLDMGIVTDTRRKLAIELGLLAVMMIAAGLVAAFLFGRRLARPLDAILASTDRFDPAREEREPYVPSRGTDEIAVLGERYQQMLGRLRTAHQEQQRVQQRSLETERLAAVGTLVAGVTHEINNPLAGIKNCAHRLARPDLPEEKRREYLELMHEGLGRVEDVVKGLLDFARPHPPLLAPTSTLALAESATNLVASQLGRRRVRCAVLDRQADGPVLADRHRIGQALVNLLLNAGYASPEGGEVRVRLVERPGMRGLAVEDDGPGIPPEVRQRILDPFFTTKPPGEGTGLGLSVTRSILDEHGGELAFEFPPRGGTVVTLWLKTGASASPPPAG
jgi:two-component system NtrC family sensor kinase